MKTLKAIIKNLNNAHNLEEIDKATKEANTYFIACTDNGEKEILKQAIKNSLDESNKRVMVLNKQFEDIMTQFEDSQKVVIEVDGEKYALNEWLTTNDYIKRFGLKSTMVVSNWIKRGIIPEENILCIKQLNNLKLIKAISYMK